MRLSAAVRKDTGVYPGDGVVGKERKTWYSVTTLKVRTGGIDIADLGMIPAHTLRIRVPNGDYLIEARLIDFGGSLCVSRVRARLKGVDPKVGKKRGMVPVDYAAIAIADFEYLRQTLDDSEQDEFNDAATEFMHVDFCEKCTISFGTGTAQIAVSKSGFGDGTYPVFALINRKGIIGLEVELIKDGYVLESRKPRSRANA